MWLWRISTALTNHTPNSLSLDASTRIDENFTLNRFEFEHDHEKGSFVNSGKTTAKDEVRGNVN